MKQVLGVLTIAIMLANAAPARAELPGRLPAERWAERLDWLDVTETQEQQVRLILKQHLPVVEPLVKEMIASRRDLREVIHAAPFNETNIRAQSARVAAAEANLAVARARIGQEIRAVLTPGQIERLDQLKARVDHRIDRALARVARRIAGD